MCGCGGGRRKASPRSAGAAQQEPVDPRPHDWVVDFPNGASQPFDQQWQANAAARIGGGSTPRKRYLDSGGAAQRNPHVQRGGFGAARRW